MAQPASSPKLVQFGVFELDLQGGELRKSGVKVKLQEQPLKILQLLLEHPGEIVSREDLRTHIWPANTFVEFDQGLYSAMARLRDALGDSSESPRFIETLARRGYRFIAPIVTLDISTEERTGLQGSPAEKLRRHGFLRLAASLLAGLLGGTLLLAAVLVFNIAGARDWMHNRTTPIRSIAVLPLENLSGDPEQEYFADGMTDELITDLAQFSFLRVVSRTSAMYYKRNRKKLPEIAQELNVDAVVEGTVARSGDHVRIRVQLVRALDDRHLWAQTYDREIRDVLSIQRDAAHQIAEQVGITVSELEQPQPHIRRNPLMKPEAYESYLKGRYYFQTGKHEDFAKAETYFQQAIEQDPEAALGYSALADVYILRAYYGPSRKEAESKAKLLANQALRLNPDLADSHLTMAGLAELDWNWAEAETQQRRALELEPNSLLGHRGYSIFLAAMGRFDQAIRETQIALQLDPLSADTRASIGFTYYLAGDFDHGIEQSRKALEIDPSFEDAHANLFYSYIQKGAFDQVLPEFEKYATMLQYPPKSIAEIKQAYQKSGIRGFWLKQIQLSDRGKIPKFDSFEMASIHALLGDHGSALDFLEKAWEEREPKMGFLRVLPELASLRSEPRFQALLQRIALPAQGPS